MKPNNLLTILITNGLLLLLLGLQYQLWWGVGGILEWRALQQKISAHQAKIQQLQRRNAMLSSEVNDLKYGLEAIEERARLDFGLIKHNEKFFQVVE